MIHGHLKVINRCFYSNSVQDIMKNLEVEGSPFALRALDMMNNNSKQAMQLALELMRRGTTQNLVNCLKREGNVALHRAEDADFHNGVERVMNGSTKPWEEWLTEE